MNSKTIHIVGLAAFKDKKVIMVTSYPDKHAYYFLGGSIEEGETDLQALEREVLEEAGVKLDMQSVKFLKEFKAQAHNQIDTTVILKLYSGNLLGEPIPSTEILDIQYFDVAKGIANPPELSKIVFKWLQQEGYII